MRKPRLRVSKSLAKAHSWLGWCRVFRGVCSLEEGRLLDQEFQLGFGGWIGGMEVYECVCECACGGHSRLGLL